MACLLSYFLCVFSLFVAVTFLYPYSCNAQYFFIFGDSLYDPGNTQYIRPGKAIPSCYPPYGTTFFNHSTGRFSDGRVLPDFIAADLNLPMFIPPALDPEGKFTNGASFASAGAGVFEHSNTEVMSFGEQVEQFKNLKEKWTEELAVQQVEEALLSAVYLISINGDDYFSFVTNNDNATITKQKLYVDSVLSHYTRWVKKIYDIGGRKFMIKNVAPIGCLPIMRQTFNVGDYACAGKPLTIAKLHNAALPNGIRELQSMLQGFKYSIFDYFSEIGNSINDPTSYGFKHGDIACCGFGSHRGSDCGAADVDFELCFDPNEYLFFDGAHNTDKANSQMADLIWNGQEDVVSPFNMRQLFELESVMKISSTKYVDSLRIINYLYCLWILWTRYLVC